MEKILLIGASGFIGKNLIPKLSKKYIVSKPTSSAFNLLDTSTFNNWFDNVDLVINLALDRNDSEFKVNTFGVLNLVKVCKEKNIPLFHLSTTAIEDDLNTDYARTKLQGEQIIHNSGLRYKIIRLPHVYVNHLRTIKYLFTRPLRSPISLSRVSHWIIRVADDLVI